MERNGGLLNGRLAAVIATLGHGDTLTVADAGLPVPAMVEVLDLALVPGVPSFAQTLKAILGRLEVESAVIAADFEERSSDAYRDAIALLGKTSLRSVSHAALKQLTGGTRLVVRTGEFTAYANVILVAGVPF